MSTIKTLTTSLTAVALVTGISFAWAQTEEQSPQASTTTAAGTPLSEQTPADPNAVQLTDNSAAMPQESAATNPPPVDNAQSSDANSQATPATQAPLNNTATTSSTVDNSTSITPSTDTSTSQEPAPRSDRN
ncbi:hypothetical protein [Roseateles sp. P5_E7]